MESTTCRVGSDRLRVTQQTDDIITFTVSGLIGLPECMGLVLRMRAACRAMQPRGLLVDMRAAVLTISTPQYVQVFNEALVEPASRRVALVVGAGLMSLARGHETLMARRGLQHRPFSSVPAALRWVTARRRPRQDQGASPLL